jgi:hypothetical protein
MVKYLDKIYIYGITYYFKQQKRINFYEKQNSNTSNFLYEMKNRNEKDIIFSINSAFIYHFEKLRDIVLNSSSTNLFEIESQSKLYFKEFKKFFNKKKSIFLELNQRKIYIDLNVVFSKNRKNSNNKLSIIDKFKIN